MTLGGSGPKTFKRGLQILEALWAAGDEGLRITDIAALTGIQRTTIYRFLSVLVEQGYALPTADNRVFAFNYAHFTGNPNTTYSLDRLKPVVARISAQTGDSCFLVRREGADSLCIHREVGSYPLQVLAVTIGHRQPLGVGAAGLALLANLPKDDIRQILAANKNVLPKFGGMTCEQMEKLIRSTQERGWSAVGNAAVPGVLGVGVPILHRSGHAIFAVSVSSVMDRMPMKRQRTIVELIKEELASAV